MAESSFFLEEGKQTPYQIESSSHGKRFWFGSLGTASTILELCWSRHRQEAVSVLVEAQACKYTAVDSKGGQRSKLPSALGTNLTRVSENESSQVHACQSRMSLAKIR